MFRFPSERITLYNSSSLKVNGNISVVQRIQVQISDKYNFHCKIINRLHVSVILIRHHQTYT
jgi:predicted RNA methylase